VSKYFGLSGNLTNKHENIMLGSEQIIANKFHDLNKKKPYSILNVCGITIHAMPKKH